MAAGPDNAGTRENAQHHPKQEDIIAQRSTTRVNDQIRISPVRLIDSGGEQLGIVSLGQAREAASEAGLDLVEIAPNARPPVVRIMDWGKYRYAQQKRDRAARKRQHVIDIKEVKFRPKIEDHDFDYKVRNARRFLEQGKKVKVTLMYRGRELRRSELGVQVMDRVAAALADVATVESRDTQVEGRRLTMMLAPA
ncbi:MAG TPA: translation initiation factor IF-3 [Longimicrobiales bacterium]